VDERSAKSGEMVFGRRR